MKQNISRSDCVVMALLAIWAWIMPTLELNGGDYVFWFVFLIFITPLMQWFATIKGIRKEFPGLVKWSNRTSLTSIGLILVTWLSGWLYADWKWEYLVVTLGLQIYSEIQIGYGPLWNIPWLRCVRDPKNTT